MKRRVSLREISHRFDGIDSVRVHVDELDRRSALMKVDGVKCELRFARPARAEVTKAQGINARVSSFPVPISSGLFARGTRPQLEGLVLRRIRERHPMLKFDDQHTGSILKALEAFCEEHPFGSVVGATVRYRFRNHALLDLGQGLVAFLAKDRCLDHEPGERVKWLGLPPRGACVDVFVRDVNLRTRQIVVSLHTLARDEKYCGYASGYRSAYVSKGSPFARLPWEKS